MTRPFTQAAPGDTVASIDQLNPLERSFVEIARANNFTIFGVTYRGEEFGDRYRFSATAHFSDALEGQIPCASGDGSTICEAINSTIHEAIAKRTIVADPPIYGEAGLLEDAA